MPTQEGISLTLAGISAGCNLVVMLIAALFVVRRQLLTERVSFRLQVAICFIDLIKNALLLGSFSDKDTDGCAAMGMFSMSLGHLYFLLNVMLAVNAHWVLLCDHPPKKRWMVWFWVIPVLLAVFFNLPLLAWSVFGKNAGGVCFVKGENRFIELVYVYGLTIVAYVYCLGVSILVLMKLRRNPNAMLVLRLDIDPAGLRSKEHIFNHLARIVPTSVAFPLVLCFSVFVSNVCLVVAFLVDSNSPTMFTWGFFGYNTIGILNLVAFLSDPLVRRALIEPPPSGDSAMEYNIDFSHKERGFLDSDSEGVPPNASAIIDWADKQFIRNFVSAT